MKKIVILALSLFISNAVHAFSWQDLWKTKDQQAQDMMNQAQFKKAKQTFKRKDWRAAANYRAGNYEQAAKQFGQLKSESGFYNQGNAFAHMGQYENGIKAYDKALALNPSNADAKYNKAVLEKLLKNQQKQNQNKQNQNKQDQNKQDQNKQNQNKQNQNKQNQDKQNQNKQNQNKQDQNKQDQSKQAQNKQDQNKQDQNKQDQNKQDQNKQDQNKQDQNKQNQNKQNPSKRNQAQENQLSKKQREQQQAKQQWLRRIPDDPGGLLKQKFLRDYLNKHQGWNQ